MGSGEFCSVNCARSVNYNDEKHDEKCPHHGGHSWEFLNHMLEAWHGEGSDDLCSCIHGICKGYEVWDGVIHKYCPIHATLHDSQRTEIFVN